MANRMLVTRVMACTLAVTALSLATLCAQQEPSNTQASLAKEAGALSNKFAGLARVMAGKYD